MNRRTSQGAATQLEMPLNELVAYFRRERDRLRSQWVTEMTAKGVLQGLNERELIDEAATIYDICITCLETGQYHDARSYAKRMAKRRVLQGMTPEQIVGGMFILSNVYCRGLIEQYRADVPRLIAALAVFQPVLNEILSIVTTAFLEERVREWTAQLEEAHEALRESEERFRLAQETAHVGVFDWNIQTGAYAWTPEMEAIHGLLPGDFARTHASWEALVHPDDRVEAMAKGRQALETNAPLEGEWRVIWPNGSVHWVFGRFQSFRARSGKLLRLTCVNVDISERKRTEEENRRLNERLEERVRERTAQVVAANEALRQSEAKYRLLFESSRDAIMMLAPPTWKFTEANPATLQMFGARTQADFLSIEPWQISPERQPDGRASEEKARAMIETAMRDGSQFFEWVHRRLNGEEFPATVLLTRMQLAGQTLLQAMVRDITEQKKATEAL